MCLFQLIRQQLYLLALVDFGNHVFHLVDCVCAQSVELSENFREGLCDQFMVIDAQKLEAVLMSFIMVELAGAASVDLRGLLYQLLVLLFFLFEQLSRYLHFL